MAIKKPICNYGGTKEELRTGDTLAGIATLAANAFTGAQEWPAGVAIASAATINLNTATGNRVHITGTTAITAVTLTRGPRTVIFDGILTLTHHATTNNLPGAANITTAAGDRAIYESDGTTVYCVSYIRVSGSAVSALTGGVTSVGNAATVVTNANLTGHITSTGNGAVLGAFTLAQLNTAISDADVATPTAIQAQTYTAFTTAGTLTAYTLTPSPAITAYAAGQSFFVTFAVASGAAPTLTISGIATPPYLVKQLGDGTYVNIAAGDITINHRSIVTLLSATQALVARLPRVSGATLQVVNLVYSTQGSMTVGTVDTDITGMLLSITPKGDASKFRIDVRLFGEQADAANAVYNLLRGTTRVNATSTLSYHGLSMSTQTYGAAADEASTPDMLGFSTIDSTGSTAGTQITYKLVGSASAAKTLWINRCFNAPAVLYETGISEIIITEIGA